jgi:single-strand DNA-binding protein
MSFNQVILFGRLTANPELKQTQNGQTLCNITIAVDRPKSKDGYQIADFINCNAWGKTADNIAKYFTKGKPILIVGSLRDNNYTDKNGTKHYSKVVLVNSVSFTLNDNSQGVSQPPQAVPNVYPNTYPTPPQSTYSTPSIYPPLPSENVDVDGFETILNDGEIPF